jgi:hypothetical protein
MVQKLLDIRGNMLNIRYQMTFCVTLYLLYNKYPTYVICLSIHIPVTSQSNYCEDLTASFLNNVAVWFVTVEFLCNVRLHILDKNFTHKFYISEIGRNVIKYSSGQTGGKTK